MNHPKLIYPDEFDRLYPIGVRLSAGSYGEVYKSGFQNVVKIQRTPFADIHSSLLEVNVYARFEHPCIIPLLHYTFIFENNFIIFFFAFPFGESFFDVIDQKLITKEDAKLDILSALHLLHRGGIAHGDLKAGNMVFYNGHINLIDFGLSKPIIDTNRGKMITGVGYSIWYIDPQYNREQYNSIKTELYPIGKIFYNIDNPFLEQLNIITEPIRDSFVAKCVEKIESRVSLDDLITNPIPGVINEPPPINLMLCDKEVMKKALILLIDYNLNNVPIEIIFLTVHLFHRCYDPLFHKYEFVKILNVCAFLAMSINKIKNTAFLPLLDPDILFDALRVLNGIIITPTIWNYLPNIGAIYPAIGELFSCHYPYPGVRPRNDGNPTPKNSRIGELFSFPYDPTIIDEFIRRNERSSSMIIKNPSVVAINVKTGSFDLNNTLRLISTLENILDERMRNEIFYDLQASILYFASELPNLVVQEGIRLFNSIKGSSYPPVRYLLYWYFGRELYKKLPSRITSEVVNPFVIKTIGELKIYFNL